MKEIPRFVRGNSTVIAVRPKWQDVDAQGGVTLTDADLTKVKGMKVVVVSSFGKRHPMKWTLLDKSTFSIDLIGMPVGNCGLEVSCTDQDGMKRRYFAAPGEFVKIVEPTSQAFIPTDGTVDKMFDMSITFSLVGSFSGALQEANEAKAEADSQAKVLSETNAKALAAEKARAEAEEARVSAEQTRTAAEASKHGYTRSCVCRCCKHQKPQYKGYTWNYLRN